MMNLLAKIDMRFIGGVLLVAGTTIGAAMLALPVTTGAAGFGPSLCLFVACWAFMLYTAYLVLQVTLWMPKETNLVSMAKATLGLPGQAACWLVYLLLLYALTAAYLAGGGPLCGQVLALMGVDSPPWFNLAVMLLLFGSFVIGGVRHVDRLNRFLMLGLSVTYVLLVATIAPHVEASRLQPRAWNLAWASLPVVITSFGFHIVIPTLAHYLHRDARKLKRCIFIGSSIPLLVYILWQWAALGAIPPQELLSAYAKGLAATQPLTELLATPWIATLAVGFAFFALATSFLGVSLSLSHFLTDGLGLSALRRGKAASLILTFLPPLGFALFFPAGFILALEYAGLFVVFLLGILPVLMVWRGRYRLGLAQGQPALGSRPALALTLLFFLAIVALEIANKLSFAT